MFEWLQIDAATLIAILTAVGALIIALATLIGNIVSVIKLFKKEKITKESVVEAFKTAILPQNINIDVTREMAKYLGTIGNQLKDCMEQELVPVKKILAILVMIMANTAAANKLTQEQKDELQQLYNYITGVSTNIVV